MSLIDRHLPLYHFSERHRTRVRASPDAVMRALVASDRLPDRLKDALMALRTLPSRLLGRAAPRVGMPGFTPLDWDGKSETVAGLIGRFWQLDGGLVPIPDADAFARFAEPGTPKLVIAFRAAPDPLGTLLTTETRVFCPDRSSLLRFAPYWMLIRIPSGLIRRRTLRAIKAAAERKLRLEQLARLDLQRAGEAVNVDEADVVLAALDAADIRAVEPTAKRQRFLREILRLAQLADARSEAPLDPLLVHARISPGCGR